MKRNYKFNRFEQKGKHYYNKEFAPNRTIRRSPIRNGYLKCKLAHHATYSLVVPDQIYFEIGKYLYWIQPLYFTANYIRFFGDEGICRIVIDISHGEQLCISFSSSDFDKHLADGSHLYRCKIEGLSRPLDFATGIAYMGERGPYLQLFHHTNPGAKQSITTSAQFWSSQWNLQGNKKMSNIHFLYLTPLPKITCETDLQEIAMSSSGRLSLRVDQNQTSIADEILVVYRESTAGRTDTIQCFARADQLAPQHVYRHEGINGPDYYEVFSPFIHRIGVEPGSLIPINGNTLVPQRPKNLDYVVLGDATTIEGLRAPYDEEETREIWKIDRLAGDNEIIRYWSNNRNSDLYSSRAVEVAEFIHDETDAHVFPHKQETLKG